ncbi:MAG: hypothetical protein AMK75_04265, partial [Planctomycetes bacterium SM23_65]
NAYVPPADETQEAIAVIWRELFGTREIGIHDNFFELGGHSLLATQVVSRLRRAFQIALPVGVLFQTPTIAGLANLIDQLRSTGTQTDDHARLLKEIEELSEEDAQRILMGGEEKEDVSDRPSAE